MHREQVTKYHNNILFSLLKWSHFIPMKCYELIMYAQLNFVQVT